MTIPAGPLFVDTPSDIEAEAADNSYTENQQEAPTATPRRVEAFHEGTDPYQHHLPRRFIPPRSTFRSAAHVDDVVVISSDEEADNSLSRHSASGQGYQRIDTDLDGPRNSDVGGFEVSRVIRSAPIEIVEDTLAYQSSSDDCSVHEHKRSCQTAQGSLLRQLQVSPPKGKAPLVAHPLLSKYTCPICLCTPYPYVVATPCGHLFCSECLFEALQVPAKHKQAELREQAAAFASFSAMRNGLTASSLTALLHSGDDSSAAAAAAAAAEEAVERDTEDSLRGRRGPVGSSHQQSRGRTSAQQRQPQEAKLDPLIGVCPVCRSNIPGGFIAHSGLAASKRPVFGLELKVGKPIDDPRRDDA